MKTYNVKIFRNGSWFRKWCEEIEIKADGFDTLDKNNILYLWEYKNGNTQGCDGTEVVAQFSRMSGYSIVEVK